jgi:hypothetical protein
MSYRVQLIDPDGTVVEERDVLAGSPDEAALSVVGGRVVRGAKGFRKVLRAKVYFTKGGQPTLVRYYQDDTVASFA